MVAREHRIRKPAEFDAVWQHGQRIRGRHLSIQYAETGRPATRFGFAVGRRTGNAVTRNRVKRQLRAISTSFLPSLAPGVDIIVIAAPHASRVSFHALHRDLLALLGQASLFVPEPRGETPASDAKD